jgi:hypothetical protein
MLISGSCIRILPHPGSRIRILDPEVKKHGIQDLDPPHYQHDLLLKCIFFVLDQVIKWFLGGHTIGQIYDTVLKSCFQAKVLCVKTAF